MSIFKRNAVIITVLLFVCMAVYLNWSYNQQSEKTNEVGGGSLSSASLDSQSGEAKAGADLEEKSAGLYYTGDEIKASGDGEESIPEYFASVRLARQQARYDATETLTAISETESASQTTIDSSLNEIMLLANRTVQEAELESLVMAKGFAECVVYISDEGVSVTVPAPVTGLSTAAVARITEIITSKTEYTAADLSIIEIK